MINNKEKKMIQRYCIYPKIAVVALIFSFVQCALIVPLEMIDDLVFQNKGFQPTGMFTALGFVIIYVIIFFKKYADTRCWEIFQRINI